MDIKDLEFRLKLCNHYLEFAKTNLEIAKAEQRTLKEFKWRLENGLYDFEEWCFIVKYLCKERHNESN